jgi:cardiolipin synthase
MSPGMDFWSVFSLVFLITAIPMAIMIILENRSPYKTAAWILVLILLPIFGVIFYLFFGQEYRKQKLFSRKGLKSHSQFRKLSIHQLRQFKNAFSKLDEKILQKENLIRLLLNNSDSLLTTGNQLTLLTSPAKTFEAIFNAIKNARHHIHLEYYILADDKIGNRMKNLLIKKAREGVEVRIIVDDVGSWGLKKYFFEDLRNSGVKIFSFMEVRFPRLTSQVNYRNHRKIIVIDGKTGFTGGVNIADRYLEGKKRIGPWNDLHLQIEGDASACLQVVFAADWFFVSKENLSGDKHFPVMTNGEGVAMQISVSGPDSDWENIGQAFFAAITNARQRAYIVSPYLMPPLQIISALKTASLSNVDVRIIIPEKSDSPIPLWCSFSYVEELLEAGVKVYFYNTGFIHSKYIIVDDVFSTVGTTNLDFRSLETNFEVNAFIYDEAFTSRLTQIFRNDMKNSREVKLRDWRQRPWHFKLRESFAHSVSPML